MTDLRISPDLSLPVDAVTETFAILAVKRAGKSNAAVVLAEEMYDAALPWVAIDPKGDWWGVRAAGNGNEKGLAVLVFGGLHGDVPLEPTAGRLVADLVVEQRITCVLDVSEMTKADQRRFLIDFADRLYRTNTEPLHVFCEEADEYIPQRVTGENTKLVGVFETLVKRGGFRGIGVTLITQRSASLNKDVLTQAGTLFAMRTPSAQDRKAVAAWVDFHATSAEMLAELPTLSAGEAWVFSPEWLKTVEKITFRRRRTYDSGATPKVGEARRTPTNLADVDLAAIKEQMAETIERAKADDPKYLRQRIAQLERDLAAERAKPTPEPIPQRVEVVPGELIAVVNQARRALLDAAKTLTETSAELGEAEQRAHDRNEAADDRQDLPRARQTGDGPHPVDRPGPPERPDRAPGRQQSRPALPRPATPSGAAGDLSKSEQALLAALTYRGPSLTRQSLGAISGYSWKSGGFRNTLSSLRTKGLLQPGDPITLTEAGHTSGAHLEAPPTGLDLLVFWEARIGKAEKAIARVLFDTYPETLTRQETADACGYTVTSGGFRNALSKLRTLGLIEPGDPLRASDSLGCG